MLRRNGRINSPEGKIPERHSLLQPYQVNLFLRGCRLHGILRFPHGLLNSIFWRSQSVLYENLSGFTDLRQTVINAITQS